MAPDFQGMVIPNSHCGSGMHIQLSSSSPLAFNRVNCHYQIENFVDCVLKIRRADFIETLAPCWHDGRPALRRPSRHTKGTLNLLAFLWGLICAILWEHTGTFSAIRLTHTDADLGLIWQRQ